MAHRGTAFSHLWSDHQKARPPSSHSETTAVESELVRLDLVVVSRSYPNRLHAANRCDPVYQ
jgi:hypothetical protein